MQEFRRNELKDKLFFQATVNRQKLQSDVLKSWTEYMVEVFFNIFNQ